MSELPNFKEGFIFDATQNNTTEANPFVITESKPCLFKIASLSDYSKDYQYWLYSNGNSIVEKSMIIQSYNDMSFLKQHQYLLIIWDGNIYLYLASNTLNAESYAFTLTRCADSDGTVRYDSKMFYVSVTLGTTPSVSYGNDKITLNKNGYEITINNPVTTLDWGYHLNDSADELKYYQFLLYNSQNKCVVDTGKIYTNTTEGNGFVCNSLDDNSTYTLVGYCVSQNGQRLDLPDLLIKTTYTTGRIYTNLTVELNKHCAENTVYAEVINLLGNTTNGKAVFVDDEKIDLKTNDNAIVFTDTYNLLTDNFVIRLWINGINNEEKVTILKLTNPYGSDYIELYYNDGYFYATKYSYGLTSRYISNVVNENDVLNGNIYLSMLYCNGRIDIYATSYAESEAIAR